MVNLTEIASAKHIVLVCDEKSFANASALYTYVLMQHKKVSLIAKKKLPVRLAFLPWFEKVRYKEPASGECFIDVGPQTLELMQVFENIALKINEKMATALYAGLILEYDFFKSSECNGMVFAAASKLMKLNAAHSTCMKNLQFSQPLSLFRIRALLFQQLRLVENATVALLSFRDEDLQSSGADMNEIFIVMDEVLMLVHVKEVRLVKSDEDNKLIKLLKGKSFEKQKK